MYRVTNAVHLSCVQEEDCCSHRQEGEGHERNHHWNPHHQTLLLGKTVRQASGEPQKVQFLSCEKSWMQNFNCSMALVVWVSLVFTGLCPVFNLTHLSCTWSFLLLLLTIYMRLKTDRGSDQLLDKANVGEFSNCIHIQVLYITF